MTAAPLPASVTRLQETTGDEVDAHVSGVE